jgi:hypothetical protein
MQNSLFRAPVKIWIFLLVGATLLAPPTVWAMAVQDRPLFETWTGWYWAILTLQPGWWVGVLPFIFPALIGEIVCRVIYARRADAALAQARVVARRAATRVWAHE